MHNLHHIAKPPSTQSYGCSYTSRFLGGIDLKPPPYCVGRAGEGIGRGPESPHSTKVLLSNPTYLPYGVGEGQQAIRFGFHHAAQLES